MSLTQTVKDTVNRALAAANLRLDSRTAERREAERLERLVQRGHFSKLAFPILGQFKRCDPVFVFEQIKRDEQKFAELVGSGDVGGFRLDNDYYTTPDAEVLFAMVQLHHPSQIIEVGSGNSTRLFQLAVRAAQIKSRLISIDPDPRRDVEKDCDKLVRKRVEVAECDELLTHLARNDILFVDSSHEIKTGNDVVYLLLTILPNLKPGVIIHLHDIFLPFDYPQEWIVNERWSWTEQYLVQALLQGSAEFDVLWPGHYLQRTWPNFAAEFKHWRNSTARSLWLQKH
jgi:hypothetical protein